jgi:hypothetical protein
MDKRWFLETLSLFLIGKVFSIELIVQKRSYLSYSEAKPTIYVKKEHFEMKKQNLKFKI